MDDTFPFDNERPGSRAHRFNNRFNHRFNNRKFPPKYKGNQNICVDNNNGNNKCTNKNNPLVTIYHETKDYFSSLSQNDIPPSIYYNINMLDAPTEGKEKYNLDMSNIEIENEDTLDMALRFHATGEYTNIMVLNMASDFKPGGGVASGKTAQEEVIFRRTNAFMTHPPNWYPLKDNKVIYSPSVYIVRDSSYNFLPKEKQISVSMVAIPAIRKPRLYKGKTYDKNDNSLEYGEDDYRLMDRKIQSIFRIGLINNVDCLVLGALGCGAFKNPPNEVAKLFNSCIQVWGKYFKKIGFAVLCVKPTDNDNLTTFKTYIV